MTTGPPREVISQNAVCGPGRDSVSWFALGERNSSDASTSRSAGLIPTGFKMIHGVSWHRRAAGLQVSDGLDANHDD